MPLEWPAGLTRSNKGREPIPRQDYSDDAAAYAVFADSKPARITTQRGLTKRASLPLTARELQVLRYVADGNTNKLMASRLSISIKTLEKHRQNLMDKLAIHDTATLTRYAIYAGVVWVNASAA